MVANTGTYLDTPFHRYPDGGDLAALPLESVANLPGGCIAAAPEGPIEPEGLPGDSLRGRAVLLATGWDRYWRTPDYGADHHPFLTEAAAEKLLTAGVAIVGIDSVNIDDTRGGQRPAHTQLLAAGVPVVEHLTGLGGLVDAAFRFFADRSEANQRPVRSGSRLQPDLPTGKAMAAQPPPQHRLQMRPSPGRVAVDDCGTRHVP